MRLGVTELIESDPQIPAGPMFEVGPGRFEQLALERDDGIVVDGERKRMTRIIVGGQESVLDERVWTDQEFVPGE